jgi:V/A-type H+-transporting ATPase subunit I
MLARMRRIDIVAPRRLVGPTLRAVHRTGAVHLVPFEPPPDVGSATFDAPVDDESAGPLAAALDRVVELATTLAPAPAVPGEPALSNGATAARRAAPVAPAEWPVTVALASRLWELDDAELLDHAAALASVRAEADRLAGERVRLGGEIARLGSYTRLIEGLRAVLAGLPSVRGYGTTGIVVGARFRSVLPAIHAELERVTRGRCEVISADVGADRVGAVLVYPLRQAAEVRSLLGGRDIEEVTLPDELAGVPFEELGPRLRATRDRLVAERDRVVAALAALEARHGREIEALRLVLADRLAEVRALRDAAASDHLVVLGGWIPARRLDAFREALEREVGPAATVVDHPVSDARGAPVALENGPLVRAFEPLASFVVVPRYGSIDPTPLLALTLPAFIGLMVGDIGYGLVLLALVAALRVLRPQAVLVRRIWPVGVVAGLSTVAFGILYGEWFGTAGAALFGLRPLWLDRGEAVAELLVFALAIGVGQVGLGLVLGVLNAALLRHRRELAGRVALLVTVGALLVALGSLVRVVPAEAGPIALAAAAVAFVLLVLAFGIAGPIEVIGVLGNILSYARLMAIGLASVMLALVANRLGGVVEGALAGVLVAGLIHALNFALGFFDASIQGIRLHYVEFFSKFVEPGGVRYRPFVSALEGTTGAAGGPGGM